MMQEWLGRARAKALIRLLRYRGSPEVREHHANGRICNCSSTVPPCCAVRCYVIPCVIRTCDQGVRKLCRYLKVLDVFGRLCAACRHAEAAGG